MVLEKYLERKTNNFFTSNQDGAYNDRAIVSCMDYRQKH